MEDVHISEESIAAFKKNGTNIDDINESFISLDINIDYVVLIIQFRSDGSSYTFLKECSDNRGVFLHMVPSIILDFYNRNDLSDMIILQGRHFTDGFHIEAKIGIEDWLYKYLNDDPEVLKAISEWPYAIKK